MPRTKSPKPAPRTPQEVAIRAIILSAVITAAHHPRKRAKIVAQLKRQNLYASVSPKESRFLRNSKPSNQAHVNATWRLEALIALLWALRILPKLPPPRMYNRKWSHKMPRLGESTAEFIANARLRPQRDLRAAQDDVYNTHWSLRDAQINGKRIPKSITPGVIWERHHAFNWLLNDDNEPWDEVSTDT